MAHLAFSEKGFTDEDYKRFLSRMPAAYGHRQTGLFPGHHPPPRHSWCGR